MDKKIKVGAVVSKRKLCGRYDKYAADVLNEAGYVDSVEGKRQVLYKIMKELPEASVYAGLRDARYRRTVSDALSEAFGEFESLRDELQEWYDNLPESFQNGSKGDALQEAVSQLEDLSEPSINSEEIRQLGIVCLPGTLRSCSRSARCSNAVEILESCVEALQEMKDKKSDENCMTEEVGECESLIDELSQAIDTANYVEFPGMY